MVVKRNPSNKVATERGREEKEKKQGSRENTILNFYAKFLNANGHIGIF